MWRATLVLSLLYLAVLATGSTVTTTEKPSDERVIGGKTAMIKDYCFIVSLQRREVHVCGGSILNERTILTAAHCALPLSKLPISAVSIRAGATLWSTGGQHIGVKDIVIHNKYNSTTKVYDFALLKLKTPLEFDNVTVCNIELATKTPGDNKDGTILGWGLKKEKAEMVSTMLQYGKVKSISKEKCGSTMYSYGEDIMESMICAQGKDIDACQGDSGGPYVINEGPLKNKLVGVVSFGRGCGRANYPGVFGAVASVSKWLDKTMSSFQPAEEEPEEEPEEVGYPYYKPPY